MGLQKHGAEDIGCAKIIGNWKALEVSTVIVTSNAISRLWLTGCMRFRTGLEVLFIFFEYSAFFLEESIGAAGVKQ